MGNVILFILYVLLSTSGLLLFKMGAMNADINLTILNYSFSFSLKSIFGIFCYGMSFILWMVIISRMNLTLAVPLSVAIVNTLVVIASCIVLKEKITFLQGFGIFIVIVGVSLIGIKK